jgi:3-hydroxybutyryl-CoA dehydrogenase
MTIERVGIIGAGQMGNGIAHVFALAGYEIIMNDVNTDALTAAIQRIDKNMERQVSRDAITADAKAEALRRINTTTTLTDLGQTDLILRPQPNVRPSNLLSSKTSFRI